MQIMLRRHQDERMDLLATVEQLDLMEAEQIHDEIMTEKSITLTDQKRRLASMLASLQVEKSREVATLRGQLNSLTKVEVIIFNYFARLQIHIFAFSHRYFLLTFYS